MLGLSVAAVLLAIMVVSLVRSSVLASSFFMDVVTMVSTTVLVFSLFCVFEVSSTCFLASAFLIEFFSEFSQLLTPVTFDSLFPTFSVGRRVFSSALSCSPNSRREPPYMSSVERQASRPSSEAPGVNLTTTVVPCTFSKRLAPLVPFTFARR